MNCVITNHELLVTGGLALLFIVLSVWVSLGTSKRTDLPDGFTRAGLALQLSRTSDAVIKTIGPENSKYREELRASIRKDFALIFSYASFFVALGLVLSQANSTLAKWLGPLAAICIVGAAAFDFIENYRMLQVLSMASENITDADASSIRCFSLAKWVLLFLTIGLEAFILLHLWNAYSLLGGAMMVIAIVGFIGLLRYPQLLPPAIFGLWLCAIAIAVILFLTPTKFLNAIC